MLGAANNHARTQGVGASDRLSEKAAMLLEIDAELRPS